MSIEIHGKFLLGRLFLSVISVQPWHYAHLKIEIFVSKMLVMMDKHQRSWLLVSFGVYGDIGTLSKYMNMKCAVQWDVSQQVDHVCN